MIELPEAHTIARQITDILKGKVIEQGIRGNSPHKFAFYNHEPEEYESILEGKTIGGAFQMANMIMVSAEPDYVVGLGCGGERILFHENEGTLPKKHQLLLKFTHGTYLSVSVQGWGAALLLHESEVETHPFCGGRGPSPLSDEFTLDYFMGLFGGLREDDPASAKYFVITKPGVSGIGNGCMQDILFHAGIHPRRRVISLSDAGKTAFYNAIKGTIREMTELGGRDSDHDLFNQPGGYKRILHSKVVGLPCPKCGTPIEKIAFLGGASYFCPSCQE